MGEFMNRKPFVEITKIFEKQIPFTYVADGITAQPLQRK